MASPSPSRVLWATISARDDAENIAWIDRFRASNAPMDAPVRIVTPHAGAAMHIALVRADGKEMDVFVSDQFGALVDDVPQHDVEAAARVVGQFLDDGAPASMSKSARASPTA